MATAKVVECGPVSRGTASRRPLFAVVAVLLGAFLASFDSRLFSLALPDIRGALSLSVDQGAWFNTAGTASQIFIASSVAWIATAFGVRRVLVIPSLVYAVVSIILPLMHDFSTLLFLNVIRGLLLGAFVPTTLLVIFRTLPMQWWIVSISIFSIRVGFSMNLGETLVGYFIDHAGWQWIYWQDAIIAPLMGLAVYLGTENEPVNRELAKDADWGGMLLLGSGMAMIYAGLDQGNRLDWLNSGLVTMLLACGTALVVGFFINEALVTKPWASADVILSRNVGLALVITLLYTLTSLSNSSLAPGFLTNVALLRLEQSGPLFLFCAVVPMIFLLPVTVYLLKWHDARLSLMVGLGAFACAGLLGTQLTSQWRLLDFVPIVLLQSIGQSFALFSIVIITLSNSNPARSTAFAAYLQVSRLGGAEIGVSLMTTFLRIREQTASNLLGLNVTRGDADVGHILDLLTNKFTPLGIGSASARATGTLAATVAREANTLAYIDGFWLTAWFAIAALVLAAFIGPPPPGPFSPPSTK